MRWRNSTSSIPTTWRLAPSTPLSLLAAQTPGDKSHTAQKKAVAVLEPLFEKQPDHPGLAHYIIHSCDSPELAPMGLNAARRYADIASSSAHAVHMPSHIFARLGLWQEDIQANLKSVALIEKTQMSGAMYMRGHELHAMDFLLYAYVQTGQDDAAKGNLDPIEEDRGGSSDQRQRRRDGGILRDRRCTFSCIV